MVKKLDDVIKKAFEKAGFTEKEVMDGCWLLEKPVSRGSSELKPIAWIALHKFLERVAQRMNIIFDEPKVMNCTENEIAIYVKGETFCQNMGEPRNQAWSIGEASIKNCKNDYRWAMAEKRAKDRVILKLLGIAGDMYSEEEADEFKEKTPAQKAAETRAKNKATKEEVEAGAKKAMEWAVKIPDNSIEIYSEDWKRVDKMENLLREWDSDLLNPFLDTVRPKIKPDEIPY